jgi:hypothetical protein
VPFCASCFDLWLDFAIPQLQPVLLVGNHQLFAPDMPPMVAQFLKVGGGKAKWKLSSGSAAGKLCSCFSEYLTSQARHMGIQAPPGMRAAHPFDIATPLPLQERGVLVRGLAHPIIFQVCGVGYSSHGVGLHCFLSATIAHIGTGTWLEKVTLQVR